MTDQPGRLRRLWRIARAGDLPRVLVVVAIVGAVLAISGGFGTGGLPLAGRLAYWMGMVIAGAVLGRFGGRLLIPRPWFETRPVAAAGLMVLIIGLPMTVISALGIALLKGIAFNVALVVEILPTALVLTAGMTVLGLMVQSRAAVETHVAAAGAPPPRFLARLPERLAGAALWAVEAQDHYLRLHTSLGQELILMRLADALAELEGIEGARTHRSWWVARDAVVSIERAEGRAVLTLPGGTRAPVSRAYARALRDAGWF